jgi:CHAD domain-containing protein
MAYRLTSSRSVRTQLARIARKELAHAIDEMGAAPPRPDNLHEARKRIKKLRAILRLLRASLGHAYHTYNRRLRTAAHELSAGRDADAALEMAAALRKHYPALVSPAMAARLRRGLERRQRKAMSRLRVGTVQRSLRRCATGVPRVVRRAASRRAARDGTADGYRRARQAMHEVQQAPADLAFHTWRRRVKDHWYHMRLLAGVHPPAQSRARALKRLERYLGDDHNLVLLRAILVGAPRMLGGARATAIVLACIDQYEARLRTHALALGARLFRDDRRTFRTSIVRGLSSVSAHQRSRRDS